MALAADVVLIVPAVVGGIIAILVLGDARPATAATRGALVVAGCLRLLVLGEYMLRQVGSLYRTIEADEGVSVPHGGTTPASGEPS